MEFDYPVKVGAGGYVHYTTDVVIVEVDGSTSIHQGWMMIHTDFVEADEV